MQSGYLITLENKKSFISWSTDNAMPLTAVEAGNGFADLEPLKKILSNVRFVGMGEATHGTREFFK